MSKVFHNKHYVMLLVAGVFFISHMANAVAQITSDNAAPVNQTSLTSQPITASENSPPPIAQINAQINSQTDDSIPSDTDFSPSFREEIGSVLYKPEQVSEMKAVLSRIEKVLAQGGPPAQEIIQENESLETNLQPAIIPDLRFPTFYIASIAYRSPKDWMLWINGQRVTPKRKFDGLQVAFVGPESVQLIWKPDEWKYRYEIWQSSKDSSIDLQKIAAHQGSTHVDAARKSLVASLRPNQTWVTVTPMIVEGQHNEFAVTVKPELQSTSKDKVFSADKIKKMLAEQAKKLSKPASQNVKNADVRAQSANTLPNAIPSNAALGGIIPSTQPTQPGAPSLPANTPGSLNDLLDSVGSPVTNFTPPTPAILAPSVAPPVNAISGGAQSTQTPRF